MSYIPPFTVSTEAINLIAEISAQIERYAIRLEQEDGLRLRKANRIKTIPFIPRWPLRAIPSLRMRCATSSMVTDEWGVCGSR